jgi:Na+/citrate or Na+/malate symporter
VAIQSVGEFAIIMNTIVARVFRMIDEQPGNTTLVTVKRQMEASIEWARKKHKPDAKELLAFETAAETIRQHYREDPSLSDQLFDLLDFLEYRL